VTDIQYHAFSGCQNLKTVIIPKNVTGIDDEAFDTGVEIIRV
jgi:hypothetical protein